MLNIIETQSMSGMEKQMKVKEITISRKFNLGNYETQDVHATFEVPDDLDLKQSSLEAFNSFHEIVHNSDLPDNIRVHYYYNQVKPFRDKYFPQPAEPTEKEESNEK